MTDEDTGAGGDGRGASRAGAPTRHRAHQALHDWRDAVRPRTALLVVGVFALMLAFAVSYIGALHDPHPHDMDLAVAAPAQQRGPLIHRLDGLPNDPVDARAVPDANTAHRQVAHRDADGALVIGHGGTARLVVASAAGPALSEALRQVVTPVAKQSGLRLRVDDIRPAASGDHNELTAFYLVVAWSVGGYLVASMLGISAGSRPVNLRRAFIRILAMAVYSVLAGLGGAIIVGPVLHALPGPTVGPLWWLGALLVFATAVMTMAFQAVAGVIGIGLAVALFVVLGNPSSGGVFPAPLLPTFWRVIGPYIATGAATQAVRNIVYFDSTHVTGEVLVIAGYAVLGVLVGVLVAALRGRRPRKQGGPSHLRET